MVATTYGPELTIVDSVVARDAQRVIDARAMLAQVKALVSDAEKDFIESSTSHGIETVEFEDGTLVTRVDADRRKIDTPRLAELVPAATFEKVTERKVSHKRFDAAVRLGDITPAVVRQVVTATPYSAIRITHK